MDPTDGGRATAKSRKTGRGVPVNPGPIGELKSKLDADGRGSGRMGPRGALSRGIRTMTPVREALVRDEPRGPILPASLGRFLDRCWSRKSAYFQRSSALLCLFRVYPADRSPTAQFGQDRDFAVTLARAIGGLRIHQHS